MEDGAPNRVKIVSRTVPDPELEVLGSMELPESGQPKSTIAKKFRARNTTNLYG
jgi:hypothetical protein